MHGYIRFASNHGGFSDLHLGKRKYQLEETERYPQLKAEVWDMFWGY